MARFPIKAEPPGPPARLFYEKADYEKLHHEAILAALQGGRSAAEAKAIADELYGLQLERLRVEARIGGRAPDS